MTTVRRRLTCDLSAKHTFGQITKPGRIALKLDKTHYTYPAPLDNDAFVSFRLYSQACNTHKNVPKSKIQTVS